jgi:hypothetical protein
MLDLEFCPQGLAAVLIADDEIGVVTPDYIEIWKLRRDILRQSLEHLRSISAIIQGRSPSAPQCTGFCPMLRDGVDVTRPHRACYRI